MILPEKLETRSPGEIGASQVGLLTYHMRLIGEPWGLGSCRHPPHLRAPGCPWAQVRPQAKELLGPWRTLSRNVPVTNVSLRLAIWIRPKDGEHRRTPVRAVAFSCEASCHPGPPRVGDRLRGCVVCLGVGGYCNLPSSGSAGPQRNSVCLTECILKIQIRLPWG